MTPEKRAVALQSSLELHLHLGIALQPGVCREETVAAAERAIRNTANLFAAWLAGTVRIRLTPGPVVNETTGAVNGTHIPEGENMQLNTGQKFSVTADTEDAAGFDTPETVTWTIDNPEVASLQVSEDTHTCWVISGAPGSAVLTATIAGLDLFGTLAVDVVPAGTATITLVAGDPVDE